jgi:hypothetical protein
MQQEKTPEYRSDVPESERRPKPQNVYNSDLPCNSIKGDFRKLKSGDRDHSPAWVAAL